MPMYPPPGASPGMYSPGHVMYAYSPTPSQNMVPGMMAYPGYQMPPPGQSPAPMGMQPGQPSGMPPPAPGTLPPASATIPGFCNATDDSGKLSTTEVCISSTSDIVESATEVDDQSASVRRHSATEGIDVRCSTYSSSNCGRWHAEQVGTNSENRLRKAPGERLIVTE